MGNNKFSLEIHKMYGIISDICAEYGFEINRQNSLNLSELIVTQLVVFLFFNSNYSLCIRYMVDSKLIKPITYKTFINMKNKYIDFVDKIASIISSMVRPIEVSGKYLMDSFPIEGCRFERYSKVFKEKKFIGEHHIGKRLYKGLRGLILTNQEGMIKEFVIEPASKHDINLMPCLEFGVLPPDTIVFGDKGFICNDLQKKIHDKYQVDIITPTKINSKSLEQFDIELQSYIIKTRKKIESFINTILRRTGFNLVFNSMKSLINKIKTLILSNNVSILLKDFEFQTF
jgi:hypothetical protein